MGGVVPATFISFSSPGNLYSIILTTGVWLITGHAYFPTTNGELSINSVSGNFDPNVQVGLSNSPNGASIIITTVKKVTAASQTYYLISSSITNTTLQYTTFDAYRIG